ncbi:peptide deformylase [Pseudoroseicyclus aestuarii]|uniref:Peptide deformylase n=1 Tax=Pseudoroseicyclus aestuarii TaxID=1795041 RepID=A0A318SR18_9RHOB|nr:peptide deformylase [Pseudoroseicyclus aestuarii]PYE84250.1 peptide deformylase [Pseudoroseicyclus aestuarii]
MHLAIRRHPDPVLRAVCTPVASFDAGLRALADAMLAAMYAAPGRGLAGPQVGETRRLFVVDVTWKEGAPDPQVFVNPEITWASDVIETAEEGCLSIPDMPCRVPRPAEIALRWQDLEGVWQEGRFDGAAARCIQHEADHLNGVLCIDYEAPL